MIESSTLEAVRKLSIDRPTLTSQYWAFLCMFSDLIRSTRSFISIDFCWDSYRSRSLSSQYFSLSYVFRRDLLASILVNSRPCSTGFCWRSDSDFGHKCL